MEDLKIVNSQQIHMSVEDCAGVQLARLSITAPGTSPNTDGIHVTRSKGVQITDCVIKTGKNDESKCQICTKCCCMFEFL